MRGKAGFPDLPPINVPHVKLNLRPLGAGGLIKSIWIEAEEWENGWNEENSNTDVSFELSDGTEWGATFFTYKNILSLAEKNKKTG